MAYSAGNPIKEQNKQKVKSVHFENPTSGIQAGSEVDVLRD